MDTTQHNRGWDLSIEKRHRQRRAGESGSEGPAESQAAAEEPPPRRRPCHRSRRSFQYPTPADLTAKDLAPNKPKATKKPRQEEGKKKKKARGEEAREPKPPEDKTPFVAIKVSTVDPLPLDGHWRHVFFTYDGSGKASGIRIYVDGEPVATKVALRLAGPGDDSHTGAHAAGMALSRRQSCTRDALPGYSSVWRALSAEEAKRLPLKITSRK
jgi:hypothetical protein